MKVCLIICVLCTFGLYLCSELYQKVLLDDPEARCLDGSRAAIYLHEGNSRKIMIYFMGGGACQGDSYSDTLESCYRRSKVQLGSSHYWPQTMTGQGILSRDPKKSFMADWTKIFVIYCDGAVHQGHSNVTYKYKDAELYFRGAVITRSVFVLAQSRFNLRNAEKVVLTGSSAGGIATFIWADYLSELLNPQTQFYPVPDSSIFLNPGVPIEPHIQAQYLSQGIENTYSLWNRDEGPPNVNCAKYFETSPWNSFSIQAALPFIKSQLLFIQSSYDSEVIKSNMKINCLSEGSSSHSAFTLTKCSSQQMAAIEDYRQYYMKYSQQLLKRGHNIWSISCSWHAGAFLDVFYESPLQRVPMGSGTSMQSSIYSFVMENQKVVELDLVTWSNNTPCAF